MKKPDDQISTTRLPQKKPRRQAVERTEVKTGTRDLSMLMSAEPPPPVSVLPAFLSVIAAVEKAHSVYGVSCDLNPRKIVVNHDGTAKLDLRDNVDENVTTVIPSSKYVAPETVQDLPEALNPKIPDSYVLGFVFYEILLGRNLFDRQFADVTRHGELNWLIWHTDKSLRAQSLVSLIDGFPSMLSQLIDGMMAKRAEERITDLGKVIEMLDDSLQVTTVFTGLSAFRAKAAERTPKISTREKVVFSQYRRLLAGLQSQLCHILKRLADPDSRRSAIAALHAKK